MTPLPLAFTAPAVMVIVKPTELTVSDELATFRSVPVTSATSVASGFFSAAGCEPAGVVPEPVQPARLPSASAAAATVATSVRADMGKSPPVGRVDPGMVSNSATPHPPASVADPPYRSVHCGFGTTSYAFVWAMGGENTDYSDVIPAPITQLR